MTINGWDIAEAGAKQVNVIWGYSAITPRSVWIPGSPSPVLLRQQAGFKPLQVIMSVSADGRNAIRENISILLSKMIGKLDIQMDGFLNSFCGTLKSYSTEELSRKKWHKVTLNFEGYEYGDRVTVSGGQTVEVTNQGTAETPARIECSMGSTTVSCTETGWSLTIPGYNVDPVVIDGETGIVTQNNALIAAVFDELPTVPPGTVHFTVANAMATLAVKFNPRYL